MLRGETVELERGDGAAEWWREAVVYQVYLRSFRDADGDGVGDLQGLRAGLPYLHELGVDAMWLSPCFPSPQRDHGYDVADYTAIDRAYGTLDDFDALVGEAHALGINVVLDLVPNHCSVDHPLFQQALAEGPGGATRELFHFADGRGPGGERPPSNWRSIFGGSVWERVLEPDGEPGQWYFHLFTPAQPDWNWTNRRVRVMFADVLRFWLDRGVDGFRIDAAGALFKGDILCDLDDPGADERAHVPANPLAWGRSEVHDVYRSWRGICEEYRREDGSDRLLVGEISGFVARDMLRAFLRADELHEAFLFDLLEAPWDRARFRAIIERELRGGLASAGSVAWTLGSHDCVRLATRYGVEAGQAPAVGLARACAASLLVLALPGPVFLYQGDELGLPEVHLPDWAITDPIFEHSGGERRGRDGCRVPLPWSGDAAPFGFSPPPEARGPWLPQPELFAAHTIERQRSDRASTWQLHRRALALRRSLPTGSDGCLTWLDVVPDVLAFRRGETFTCATNFASEPRRAPRPGPPQLATRTAPTGWLAPHATAWWIEGVAAA